MPCPEETQFVIFFTSKVGNLNEKNIKVITDHGRQLIHSVKKIEIISHSHFWLLDLDKKELQEAMREVGSRNLNILVKLVGPDTLLDEIPSSLNDNYINDETGRKNFLDTEISIEIQQHDDSLKSRIKNIKKTAAEELSNKINLIIEEEKRMIEEIIEMEPHNKFALMQINYLNNHLIESAISDEKQLPEVLKKLEANISNIKCLINKYPRQRPVFDAALYRETFRFF